MRWSVPCVVRCDGCGALGQSEIHFARFNAVTPRGLAQGNADQPMVPPGWSEATIRPQARIATLQRPTVDPFTTPAQELADKSGAPQPVMRCEACSSKADDRAAFEDAGAKVEKREIILGG